MNQLQQHGAVCVCLCVCQCKNGKMCPAGDIYGDSYGSRNYHRSGFGIFSQVFLCERCVYAVTLPQFNILTELHNYVVEIKMKVESEDGFLIHLFHVFSVFSLNPSTSGKKHRAACDKSHQLQHQRQSSHPQYALNDKYFLKCYYLYLIVIKDLQIRSVYCQFKYIFMRT